MNITVLIDDSRGDPNLKVEHGLALWVEAAGSVVLFDTGASAKVIANAERRGVPLENAEAIVLSHGHYDHSGGLAAVLARARFARVIAHPAVVLPRWARRHRGLVADVGMPPQAVNALAAHTARTTRVTDHVEIVPSVHVTGPIPRRRSDEGSGEPFFLDRQATLADRLPDDQALWVETAAGPVVVVGCAHSGVLATLDRIAELRGDDRVRGVVGGMHLLHAGREQLDCTVAELERRGVSFVAPGHCTGRPATALFRECFGERCLPLGVGRRLRFD